MNECTKHMDAEEFYNEIEKPIKVAGCSCFVFSITNDNKTKSYVFSTYYSDGIIQKAIEETKKRYLIEQGNWFNIFENILNEIKMPFNQISCYTVN